MDVKKEQVLTKLKTFFGKNTIPTSSLGKKIVSNRNENLSSL